MPQPVPIDRRRHGFTLVELLAVLAIVGILASLVLMTVGMVRRKAKLSRCMGNFRQIAVAYNLEIVDNKGMLYYLKGSINGSGGSGQIAGNQSSSNTGGYFEQLLEPYGLSPAKWDAWKPIPNRYDTVWYCPVTADMPNADSVAGHGCSYYYYNLGQYIGETTSPVSRNAVAEHVQSKPFLCDYYGSHEDPAATYAHSSSIDSKKFVRAYLDGHIEYR